MKRHVPLVTAVVLIGLVAAASLLLRLPGLSERPMHTDEAVQAVKFESLWHQGEYRYDPAEYHGPTLYYLTLPSVRLSGLHRFADTTESTFRSVPLVFAVGLILLLPLVADGIGRRATVCAAVLTAISPAMAFYSRYYIQEMLLVFFTFAFVAFGWRYVRSHRIGWGIAAGASLGLMYATKETWALSMVALLASAALTSLWSWWLHGHHVDWNKRLPPRTVGWVAVVAIVVSSVFFSSFFTNARGPLDALLAYGHYVAKGAGGEVHRHPAGYYMSLLLYQRIKGGPLWSEGLIVGLALVGAVAALLAKRERMTDGAHAVFVRFAAFYTIVLTAIYSLIPYKTPWCVLGFLHGMIVLAGFGAVAIVSHLPGRILKTVAALLLVAGGYQLTQQAILTTGRFEADRRNPYVYAHTARDVFNLAERAELLAKASPQGYDLPIHVYAADPWPLPWYLRRFPHVGYWATVPEDNDAPLIFVSTDLEAALQPRLAPGYQSEYFSLRPGSFVAACIRRDLWDAFLRMQAGAVAPPVEAAPAREAAR